MVHGVAAAVEGHPFVVDAIGFGGPGDLRLRTCKAADPVIYGGDYIVVDSSQTKSAWHNVISAIPFIGAFAAF